MTDYVISMPSITAATLSPNPVNFNATFTISVSITEIEVTLSPEVRYSGTFYSGEED